MQRVLNCIANGVMHIVLRCVSDIWKTHKCTKNAKNAENIKNVNNTQKAHFWGKTVRDCDLSSLRGATKGQVGWGQISGELDHRMIQVLARRNVRQGLGSGGGQGTDGRCLH